MSDLNPGRELDALIAEKVMGLDVIISTHEYNKLNDVGTASSREPIKSYSTNISAAWEVVEKFNRGDYNEKMVSCCIDIEICDCPIGDFKDGNWVSVSIYSPSQIKVQAFGKTAPHAICLAALKAVENV